MGHPCINRRMEDREMANDITSTNPAVVEFNPRRSSLLEMRQNPQMFPRLKSIPREQAVFGMSKIVSQAFLYRGQAADPTNIQFISSALVTELMNDDKYGASCLSLAEIQVVVKRAVLGGSEMFGISVATLYKVIMDFVKGEGHLNQQKVDEMRKQAEERQLRDSVVAPMLQAYTGEFLRNHKI